MEDDPLAFLRGEVIPAKEDADTSRCADGGLCVLLETDKQGMPSVETRQTIRKALELAGELGVRTSGVLIETQRAVRPEPFCSFGLQSLYHGLSLCTASSRAVAGHLARWAVQEKPNLWLFPDTPVGRELGARVAMRLDTGFVTSVTQFDLNANDRTFEMTHAELGEKMKRVLVIKQARPQMATLATGTVSPAEPDPARNTAVRPFPGT